MPLTARHAPVAQRLEDLLVLDVTFGRFLRMEQLPIYGNLVGATL